MFGPLFDLSFWFNLQPSAFSPVFERAFFILFAGLILLGAGTRIQARYKKGDKFLVATYRKVAGGFTTMGVLGLLWYFFSYETAYLIGARFWFLLWIIASCVWAVAIYRYVTVQVPAQRESLEHVSDVNKYLPRRNGR